MLQCFVSHCTNDLETIVKPLDKILSDHFSKKEYKFFCSSTSSNPLLPGTVVGEELKTKLRESKCMIAIVTDNYLRSPISLTELSSMWFSCNTEGIIPIVYCSEGEKYFKQDFISNLIYINATDSSRSRINAELMMNGLKQNGFECLDSESFLAELTEFFETCHQQFSRRPYIGSSDIFQNINLFCEGNGIKKISSGTVNHSAVIENLEEKNEIYFVMTTGSSFIDTYSKEFLQKQISRGTSVYMILPNRKSDFCRDVAFIESLEHSQSNLERLTMEFDMVVKKLRFVLDEAKRLASKPEKIGHIYLCAAYTLLRQTICLGSSNNGECWGWITTTLPPVRAAGNTPTILFEGNLNDEHFIGKAVYHHITQMVEVARKRNGLVDLEVDTDFSEFSNDEIIDIGERSEIEKKWENRYVEASNYMEKRKRLNNYALIEIAAQHPLVSGKPGDEFKARLDYGFQLYKNLLQSGKEVSIYVPGSIHMDNGIADPVSLSEAGCTYLKELGVTDSCLYGEKENNEYMGNNGVYNSCDECYVSSNIFKDSGFGELHCVCSPNQVLRKQLFYLNNKVIPVIHTVTCKTMYHSFTDELFNSIPTVLYKYPNWSEPECPMFHKSREERMPGYKKE